MKKFFVALVMVVFLFTGVVVHGQVRPGSVTISPVIGGYMFEGNEDLDNSLSVGLRGGYNFTKYIGVEGFVHYVPTQITGSNENTNYLGYGVEGLLHLLPNSPLVPFVAVGVGGIHYSTSYNDTTDGKRDKFAVDYGAGVKYFLSDNWALRADVRHVMPFDDVHNNLLYTIGLSFAFGGAKKAAAVSEGTAVQQAAAPAEIIMDSDKDGVPDNLDKCPGTPQGITVDKDGCPLDSDRDGVYDYQDKCPGTAIGVSVDKEGCPPAVLQESKAQAEAAPELIEKGRTTLKVYFDTNKAVIKKNSYKEIDNLAAVLKQYPDLKVTIEGHTDSVGGDAYNKKLSQKRAEAVKKYLVEKSGIAGQRLTAKGYGEEKPIASNKTKEGREKNRRVEAAVDYVIKK